MRSEDSADGLARPRLGFGHQRRVVPVGVALVGAMFMLAGCGSTTTAQTDPDSNPATTTPVVSTEPSATESETLETESESETQSASDSTGETVVQQAKPSGLPLPDVADGGLLFAGTYGANDCVETTFGGGRQSTLGVDCQGPTLPYWFTDAGELIVDTTDMTDEMLIRFTQDLQYENASSPVVIEWSRSAGISPQFIGIANVEDLVRVEAPYYIAVVDVCQWDVQYGREAEGANLVIAYGLPNDLRYKLNAMPNPRFTSLNQEGFDAPTELQQYLAQRGADCSS